MKKISLIISLCCAAGQLQAPLLPILDYDLLTRRVLVNTVVVPQSNSPLIQAARDRMIVRSRRGKRHQRSVLREIVARNKRYQELSQNKKIGAPRFKAGSQCMMLRIAIDPKHSGHTGHMKERDLFRTPQRSEGLHNFDAMLQLHKETGDVDNKWEKDFPNRYCWDFFSWGRRYKKWGSIKEFEKCLAQKNIDPEKVDTLQSLRSGLIIHNKS